MTVFADDVLATVTCSSTRHPAVGRFQRRPDGVELVGMSRQRPGSVLPPAPGSTAIGTLFVSDAYRGCPSCGADNIVRCGACGQLSCWDVSWPEFSCPSCGNRGRVDGVIDELTQLAGG